MTELKRILLVEDDPYDTELICAGLAGNDLANEIVAVRDGEEAFDYLYSRGKFSGRPAGNPDVVLLDLKLPKIGGLEVLREIRTDDKLKVMPVVILTSSNQESDIADGYRLGTNGFVVKPIDFDQFFDAVRAIGTFWTSTNEPPPGSACKR